MKVCEPLEDTIAAIATPIGTGGVGIIKISGPEAWALGRHLFHLAGFPETIQSHHLYHGHIVDPETEKTVDEVLVSFMRAPSTYTREDVVEINCHGGPLPLQRILGLLLRYASQTLAKAVPVAGWIVSGVIGASATWAVGRAALAFYGAEFPALGQWLSARWKQVRDGLPRRFSR